MKAAAIAAIMAGAAVAGTTDDGIPDSVYLQYAEGFRP